ncbi:MAG: hypothetical protein RJA44_1663 [Pseudomonadota bacterium]
MLRRSALPWLGAVLGAAVLAWWRTAPTPQPLPMQPPVHAVAAATAASAAMTSAASVPCLQPLPALDLPQAGRAQHHAAAALALTPDRLAAFWFAGTREGAADVVILRAEFDGRQWLPAEPVLDAPQLGRQIGRAVRKLGNPVVWLDRQGQLHMAVVHVTLGGWAMARLAHLRSADQGRHFDSAEDWISSPFLNLSTLVRQPPLLRADGSAWLPVYHELALKRPELLLLDADGHLQAKRRLSGGRHLLQPAVAAAADGRTLIALSRSGDASVPRIHQQTSTDAGLSWSVPAPLALPNPDAGIALAAWPERRGWLLAYNSETQSRRRLALAWRAWDDPDGRWQELPISFEESHEASYPVLVLQAAQVHLIYTRNRETIAHRRWQLCPAS